MLAEAVTAGQLTKTKTPRDCSPGMQDDLERLLQDNSTAAALGNGKELILDQSAQRDTLLNLAQIEIGKSTL